MNKRQTEIDINVYRETEKERERERKRVIMSYFTIRANISSKWKFLGPQVAYKITGPYIKITSKAKHPNIAHR